MNIIDEKNNIDLSQINRSQANEILLLKQEIQWLKEQLGLAKHRQFAPSTEASPPGQETMLFNEAEVCASEEPPAPETEVITYTRKKIGQRDKLVENLPTEEIDYTLPEEERVCPQCTGPLHEMGKDVRREIKIIPAQVFLVLHNSFNYTCRHCQNHEIKTPIIAAPMPISAFPNSLASPTAVAHIMSQKFVLGMPLYRQEQHLEREGFKLSRQTMANWMLTGASWLEKIYAHLHRELLLRDILHADETSLQVLKEPDRAAQAKSYMWLYRTGREGPPIILFEYQPTRAANHPEKFLETFSGFLQVDGYAGYEKLSNITPVGCWAHARRKFVEAVNVLPSADRKKGGTPAHAGLAFCDKLFAIERELKDATAEERFAGREERSKPVLDAFRLWLDDMAGKTLPKSAIGTAVNYCRNQWPKLTVFLSDGRLELDNNRSERSIKPFVIGRKNWLFANTPRGARSSAIIYSIVETAKENGLNPFAYLTYLFEELPNINCKNPQALELLLPWADAVKARCSTPLKPTNS